MKQARIDDRGDGPKIAGTRITVYTILEYLNAGRSRDWMAAALGLSSQQVQAAVEYIDEHRNEVEAEYQGIVERIRAGNPPEVEEQLRANRDKLKERMSAGRAMSQ